MNCLYDFYSDVLYRPQERVNWVGRRVVFLEEGKKLIGEVSLTSQIPSEGGVLKQNPDWS